MSNNKQYFHFTLGPVQGFVAQARRTRDFWAGSFLLSWLSAVAMKSVQEQTGDKHCIKFPEADATFLEYISGIQTGNKPTQGSVPNRFKAEVPLDFKAENVTQSVQEAWEALAKLIFSKDLEKQANDNTRKIWQRQLENFWDISWVLVTKEENKEENSAALDQRKNWRSYVPSIEAGVKCMMMDGWQELSGIETPHSKGLENFWSPLQKQMQNDLREGEHLCAMAFIKRRFVWCFDDLNQRMPDGWTLSGWELPKVVPSVAYLAGAHWLEQVIEQADESMFEQYYQQAYQLSEKNLNEWRTRLYCIERLKGIAPENAFNKWTSLDGNVFHPTVLENVNTYPDTQQAAKTQQALKKLNQHVKEKLLAQDKSFMPASPFYAVLMMDGDSLGKHMSGGKETQSNITKALEMFTKKVQQLVEKHSGFLIYAGGDDVLAILPLEDALPCAVTLRSHYNHCFNETDIPTTLSGAIEYVHIKIPLTKALFDAHHLLDDIAKDKTGRDSIAVRVQKPGGLTLEWSQPWEIALDKKGVVIDQLAEQFRKEQTGDALFSSKFFFKIRERFDLLNPAVNQQGAITHPAILKHEKEEDIDLMCMEYLNSGASNLATMQQAKTVIAPLLTQCRRVTRDINIDNKDKWKKSNFLRADGALLVRFLAHKGVER